MATGSAADDDGAFLDELSPTRTSLERVLESMLYAPGRSTAILLTVVPYLWLFYYMATTAVGLAEDPIIAGDWLTLVFTFYALFASLALAQRILKVGLSELTEEYLIDVVVLTWLMGFYFVWMLARESVDPSTTVEELYGPVLAGRPYALAAAGILLGTTVLVAGLIHRPKPETKLFKNEFRTAMVTLPSILTATVLLFDPGTNSVLWPIVGGVFLGTILGGLTRIQRILSDVAKGGFAVASLVVWLLGALAWIATYRSRPPKEHVVLSHVAFGSESNAGATVVRETPPADRTDDDE